MRLSRRCRRALARAQQLRARWSRRASSPSAQQSRKTLQNESRGRYRTGRNIQRNMKARMSGGRPFSPRRYFWVAQERNNVALAKPSILSPRYPRYGVPRGAVGLRMCRSPVLPFSWFPVFLVSWFHAFRIPRFFCHWNLTLPAFRFSGFRDFGISGIRAIYRCGGDGGPQ